MADQHKDKEDVTEGGTIAEDAVVTKYKMAGEMVNRKYFKIKTVQFFSSYLYFVLPFSNIAGVLKDICSKCVQGASVRELCDTADKMLMDEVSKVYKKEKELKKGNGSELYNFDYSRTVLISWLTVFVYLGIAFPTCISPNHCICNFSPLASEPDYILQDGDLVKM
jgi:hypothetical protein